MYSFRITGARSALIILSLIGAVMTFCCRTCVRVYSQQSDSQVPYVLCGRGVAAFRWTSDLTIRVRRLRQPQAFRLQVGKHPLHVFPSPHQQEVLRQQPPHHIPALVDDAKEAE